jgi:hypothetical protein
MKTFQSSLAVLCVILTAAPSALAQQYSWQKRQHSWLTDPYQEKTIDPASLANSERVEKLVRAGKLYLSLQDAIALALENNLDIELPLRSADREADLLRAQAGGLLRGVSQSVRLTESVEAR